MKHKTIGPSFVKQLGVSVATRHIVCACVSAPLLSLCSSPLCSSCSQTDLDVSLRNNKKFCFLVDKDDQYSPLPRYKFSHNLPPHPQGFWHPRVCLHATCFWFTPSPLWMWVSVQCLFFLRPRSQCLHVLGVFFCLNIHFLSIFLDWETGRSSRTVSHCDVPSTMSVRLPEVCLTGTVGSVVQTCAASCPDAPFYSILRKRRCCNTIRTDWWGLWVFLLFEMQTKGKKKRKKERERGLCAEFPTKMLLYVEASI